MSLKRPYTIEITNVSMHSFVDYIQVNSSISSTGAVTMFTSYLRDVPNYYNKVLIKVESSEGNYDLVLANKTINNCELHRNRIYLPILSVMHIAMTKNGVVPTTCPVKKVLISVIFLYINQRLTINLLEAILYQGRYN